MKEYRAIFWRGNSQLKAGGYETERTVVARTAASAARKAEKEYGSPLYGSMTLIRIEEVK